MGKPSKFEQDTRDKLADLKDEWSDLEKEHLNIRARQEAVKGKMDVLEGLFTNGGKEGGSGDGDDPTNG